MDFKKLFTRSISGLIYIAIIIGCILWGTEGVIILASLLGTLAILEFHKICNGLEFKRIPTILLDIAGCLSLILATPSNMVSIVIWIFLIILRFVEELYLKSDHAIKNIALSMMSQLYIGVPMGLMVMLADFFMVPTIILAIFIFIWLNDTGAFIVGCTFGKHRLFERISPKKSWEGFWGGLIINLIASWFLCKYFCYDFGLDNIPLLWAGLALIVSVFATWGDLVESMIKRELKIKDSGNIIPGHGGILDRIDSLLLVIPAVTVYLTIYIFLS